MPKRKSSKPTGPVCPRCGHQRFKFVKACPKCEDKVLREFDTEWKDPQ